MYYDSEFHIQEKTSVFMEHGLVGVNKIFPQRPLTMASFYFNYLLAGMTPVYFRVFNLALLAATSMVVVLLLKLMLDISDPVESTANSRNRGVSVLAGLVFLVHPLQTWVTLYIWQRSALMACFFYFSSLALYLAARSGKSRHKGTIYTLSLISFVCAVLSKENSVALPLVIILAEIAFFRAGWKQLLRPVALFLPAALLSLFILSLLEHPHGNPQLGSGLWGTITHYYKETGLGFTQVALTQCRVWFTYLSIIVAPLPSKVQLVSPQVLSSSIFDPSSTLPALLGVVMMVGLGLYLLLRKPVWGFGILFFVVNLLPESLLVPQFAFFGYRPVLPMFGVLLIGAACLKSLENYFSPAQIRGRLVRMSILALLAVGLAGTSIVTVGKAESWSNKAWFWKEVVENFPKEGHHIERSVRVQALLNLGKTLVEQQDLAGAMFYFQQAAQIAPESGPAHNNMGAVCLRAGKFEEAAKHFKEALKLNPNDLTIKKNLELAEDRLRRPTQLHDKRN